MKVKEIAVLAGIGVLTGVVAYKLCSYLEKRKETSQWRLYKEIRDWYDTARLDEDEEMDEGVDVEPDIQERAVSYDMDLEPIPSSYKVVPGSEKKPELEEVLTEVKEVEETLEEAEPMGEDEYQFDDGAGRARFDDSGMPIFDEADWESEGDSITLLSQREYLDMYQNHEKKQAVWFSMSDILVDTDLKPIDIVDTVGPAAFTTLIKNPELTVYVKNDELETDYELFVNDSCTIETAWEEQGV